jgi:hypothetical protein
MSFRAPPIGCGRPYLVTMNGEPWAGYDTEYEARKALEMYQDRKDGGKFRFELRTQTAQPHLDPCKEGSK